MSTKGHAETVEGLRRIVLTGFMGSGKTTVGRSLAAHIGWRFADLDDSIEELLGLSVPQVFAEQGEGAFRAAELNALRELLAGSRVVIALGGGAPEAPGLRDLLAGAPETAVIYLQGSFDPLYERCMRQALDPAAVARPLLRSRDEAEARFRKRQEFYDSVATHTVSAISGSPEEVAAEIVTALGSQVLTP